MDIRHIADASPAMPLLLSPGRASPWMAASPRHSKNGKAPSFTLDEAAQYRLDFNGHSAVALPNVLVTSTGGSCWRPREAHSVNRADILVAEKLRPEHQRQSAHH
jgi:hypothetical protein